MKPFDRHIAPDVQEELDRLEAALRGDGPADDELSALVEDVRAIRPTLDADARERLEQRAQAASDGAGSRPTVPRTTRGLGRRRWRVALVVAVVVVAAVPVAGVVLRDGLVGTTALSVDRGSDDSGSATSELGSVTDDADSGPPVVEEQALEPLPRTEQSLSGEARTRDSAGSESAPSTGRASSSGSSSSRRTPSGSSPREDRSVIREAGQTVRVERNGVAAAASKVSEVVADQDGYVATSSVSETGGAPRAAFEIVVPSARLDATIAAIGRIGTPVRLERASGDVTDQRVSIDERLRDLRADRSSVRLQLARATESEQRAAKRRELRLLSSRITRLESEQRALREQVSTARLSLRLTTARSGAAAGPADDDGRWGLADAWDDAGDVLQVVGGVLLIAVAILVPLAALVALLLLGGRRLTSGRKNRTIDDA